MAPTFVVLIGIIVAGGVHTVAAQPTQAPGTEQRFDTASIKPSISPFEAGYRAGTAAAKGETVSTPIMGIRTQPGGRFLAGATLKELIAYACDVKDYQVDGGPKWISSDYFEVIGNPADAATPADVRGMLRSLLAERFALRVHTGTREAPMHVLTVGRADGQPGPRLTRTTPECLAEIADRKNSGAAPSPPPNMRGGFPAAPTCGRTMMMGSANGGSGWRMSNVELSELVSQISREVSAPVLDKTGLTGPFDIALDYLSESRMFGQAPGLSTTTGTDTPPPTLVPALQQQLGLKLDKQVAPMPVVVVDAAERPTPN